MSQAVKNNYYMDQYSNTAVPASKPLEAEYSYGYEEGGVGGAEYQDSAYNNYQADSFEYAEVYEEEEYVGGDIENEESSTEFGLIEDYQAQLKELKETIQADSSIKNKTSLISAITTALNKVNQVAKPGLTDARVQALLGEVDLQILEIQADLEMQPAIQQMNEAIDKLKTEIEDAELPPEQEYKRSQWNADLDKLKNENELKPGEEERTKLDDAFAEIEDDFQLVQDNAQSGREEAIGNIQSKKDDFLEKLESSKLSQADKDDFESQMETKFNEVSRRIELGEITAEQGLEELETIDAAAGKKNQEKELVKFFDQLPTKIPDQGDEPALTTELALKIKRAVNSGAEEDWKRVKNFMREKMIDNEHDGANNIIMQLVGSLYHKVLEGDNEKLNQCLDLISEDVQDLMEYALLKVQTDETNDAQGAGDDATRQSWGYFGTPNQTWEAFVDSRKYAEESAGQKVFLTSGEELGGSND